MLMVLSDIVPSSYGYLAAFRHARVSEISRIPWLSLVFALLLLLVWPLLLGNARRATIVVTVGY
jgi:hypothetical protein